MLTSQEHDEGAFERSPDTPRNLESAAHDKHEMVIWNGEGRPTVLDPEAQDALIGLLIKGKLKVEHFEALVDAAEQDTVRFAPLLDLFQEMVGYLPPEEFGRAKERLQVMWQDKHSTLSAKRFGRVMKGVRLTALTAAVATSALSGFGDANEDGTPDIDLHRRPAHTQVASLMVM